MLADIKNLLVRPEIFTPSETSFWTDEHISKQLLAAHLNSDYEGASRRLNTIEDSVAWIAQTIPPQHYQKLLDVGCGPGLYAERFCEKGYEVTGVDFSQRSIDYARESAQRKNLDINYLCQDYLELITEDTFDVATFIYCDFGALSPHSRSVILQNIHACLNPRGRLLLDVFSLKKLQEFQESQTWKICQEGGFWSADPYLELHGCSLYPHNVTLEQTVVITEEEMRSFLIWNCFFSVESLIDEVEAAGFKVIEVFGDVSGNPFSDEGEDESKAIAVMLEKVPPGE